MDSGELPDMGSHSNGVIRVYSDSKESLDRLFNPSNTQATVPLRKRNLPASFFNPSWQTDTTNSSPLHCRSTSFDQRPSMAAHNRGYVHMRTQSTLAPMPTGLQHQLQQPQQQQQQVTVSTNPISTAQQQQPIHQPMPQQRNGSNISINQLQPQQPQPRLQPQLQAQPQQQQVGSSANLALGVQQPMPQVMPQQSNGNGNNVNQHHHHRNFSSPAFMNFNNTATTTQPATNQFYSPNTVRPQAQNPYYNNSNNNLETVSSTTSLADPDFIQQQPTAMAQQYYQPEPTRELSQVIAPCSSHLHQNQPSPPHNHDHLGLNDHHQRHQHLHYQTSTAYEHEPSQQFHITHSQPYVPYDHTLSTGTGLVELDWP